MSGPKSIQLPPGHHPHAVTVQSGQCDVFAIGPDGLTYPLGTAPVGSLIPAAREHVHLHVVARLDSSCALVETVHYPDHAEAVNLFTSCLADRLGPLAEAFIGAAPDHVPALLSQQVTTHLSGLMTETAAHRDARARLDQRERQSEYARLAGDIRSVGPIHEAQSSDPLIVALTRIGRRQGFEVAESTSSQQNLLPPDRLVGVAHASGFRFRRVRLDTGWDVAKASPFLAFLEDDDRTPVALIARPRGYVAFRGTQDTPVAVTPEFVSQLGGFAYEITTPLNRGRAASWRDLVKVAMKQTGRDWFTITAMAGLIAVLGLLTPIVTQYILGRAVPAGSIPMVVQAGVTLIIVALASGLFSMVMYFTISRVTQEATARVQPALWDRMLSMPASFFRGFSSGDLSVRVMAADALQQLVSTQVVGSVLAAVFSLVNLALMFYYSTALGLLGLGFIALTAIVLVVAVWHMQRLYTDSVNAQLKSTSWIVQLLTGIGKIRLAGAEARMELPYLERVRQQMTALARMTMVMGRVNGWFLLVVPLATACFYLVIGSEFSQFGSPVSSPTFLAFVASFSLVFGAVNGLIAVLSPLASAGPILRLLHPILTSLPESAQHRSDPGPLQGGIEFRNVVFRYAADSPIVLDRLSFTVKPGEFVALVGPSGSGKSSSIRLILGFESPEDGQVLIDGRDLADLDLDLVRGQMGVVIQDGQITRTSILNNILGSVGGNEEDAWKAAAAANLDDDIRAMPMKMQTMVDPQIVSGGQAQRILLARALVRRPRVVILDEATSALDNESQARVTRALSDIGSTRIVVAHRLSTIQTADRIIVIKAGRVVQQGTYRDLLAVEGEFADLARRQLA